MNYARVFAVVASVFLGSYTLDVKAGDFEGFQECTMGNAAKLQTCGSRDIRLHLTLEEIRQRLREFSCIYDDGEEGDIAVEGGQIVVLYTTLGSGLVSQYGAAYFCADGSRTCGVFTSYSVPYGTFDLRVLHHRFDQKRDVFEFMVGDEVVATAKVPR